MSCRLHACAALPPGNQVAQSVRAQQAATGDDEAMHANAAGLQGQLAAAISVLDLAGGGGHFDANGALIIKAEHVQVRCSYVLLLSAALNTLKKN